MVDRYPSYDGSSIRNICVHRKQHKLRYSHGEIFNPCGSIYLSHQVSISTKVRSTLLKYCDIYSDGDLPNAIDINSESKLISYWNDQSTFVDGLCQETCRDLGHVGYGLASISHVAETARIQGRDLYQEETGTRLRYALEFHSRYENGASVPNWLCGGAVSLGIKQGKLISFPEPQCRIGAHIICGAI
jgi:hypothetical protein